MAVEPWANQPDEIAEPYRQMHRLIKEQSAHSSAMWSRLATALAPLVQIAAWDFGGQEPSADEAAMVEVAHEALAELAADLGLDL